MVPTTSPKSVSLCSSTFPCWHRRLNFPWPSSSVWYVTHQRLWRHQNHQKATLEVSSMWFKDMVFNCPQFLPCRRGCWSQPWLAQWRTDLLWQQLEVMMTLGKCRWGMKEEALRPALDCAPVSERLDMLPSWYTVIHQLCFFLGYPLVDAIAIR